MTFLTKPRTGLFPALPAFSSSVVSSALPAGADVLAGSLASPREVGRLRLPLRRRLILCLMRSTLRGGKLWSMTNTISFACEEAVISELDCLGSATCRLGSRAAVEHTLVTQSTPSTTHSTPSSASLSFLALLCPTVFSGQSTICALTLPNARQSPLVLLGASMTASPGRPGSCAGSVSAVRSCAKRAAVCSTAPSDVEASDAASEVVSVLRDASEDAAGAGACAEVEGPSNVVGGGAGEWICCVRKSCAREAGEQAG